MWSPQLYKEIAASHCDNEAIENAIAQSTPFVYNKPYLPNILTLNHLAKYTGVDYQFLRNQVSRGDKTSYRIFPTRKRTGGLRFIHVPAPKLLIVQRWLHSQVLSKTTPHICADAFYSGSSISKSAAKHCGAQWMVKLDISSFFESISEIQIYRAYRSIGYEPLVAFELARLSTVKTRGPKRQNIHTWKTRNSNKSIPEYNTELLGYLPQGAPTSPILSNIVMRSLDSKFAKLVSEENGTYSRYSDDLVFSFRERKQSYKSLSRFAIDIEKLLAKSGFKSNSLKRKIIGPGTRKIVLGLLVDGSLPKLTREFKSNLRQHFYYLEKFGPVTHAENRNFLSVWGLKCHLRGLIDHANSIEPAYAKPYLQRFKQLEWPV